MAAPRWKQAIESALSKNEKSNVMQISTVSSSPARPHVRSHIFRSFVSPESKPSVPILLSSTDIRTPKVTQILANPFVEIAWWIEGTSEQFRIFGKTSIVPSPHHENYDKCMRAGVSMPPSQSQHVNAGLGNAYAALAKETNFDWEAKRVEVFKTMSAHMKASWCRPTPGSKLSGGDDEAKKWPERVEEPSPDDPEYEKKMENWNKALGNFALVLVDPLEIDYVELGVVPNRRTRFWRQANGDDVEWLEEALAP